MLRALAIPIECSLCTCSRAKEWHYMHVLSIQLLSVYARERNRHDETCTHIGKEMQVMRRHGCGSFSRRTYLRFRLFLLSLAAQRNCLFCAERLRSLFARYECICYSRRHGRRLFLHFSRRRYSAFFYLEGGIAFVIVSSAHSRANSSARCIYVTNLLVLTRFVFPSLVVWILEIFMCVERTIDLQITMALGMYDNHLFVLFCLICIYVMEKNQSHFL